MSTSSSLRCVLLFLVIALTATAAQQPSQPGRMDEWQALELSLQGVKPVVPNVGFVPDEQTAIRIAEAVAIAQYGEKTVAREGPFKAHLAGGVWTIKGTLHPAGIAGGTVVARLSERDGRVLLLTHQE